MGWPRGKPRSAADKAAISATLRGRKFPEEHKRNIAKAAKTRKRRRTRPGWVSPLREKPLSEAHRKAISAAHRNNPNMGAKLRGRKLTAEHRANVSAALRAIPDFNRGPRGPMPLEHRQAISRANTGRKLTPEHIEKIRAANKGRPSPFKGKKRPPEFGEKISRALKGKSKGRPGPHRPETVAKIRAARLRLAQDKEREARRIAASARAMAHHPNRLEASVLAHLSTNDPTAGWKFNTGLVVGGKVPDLIRSDNVPVVVDVHGDFWHKHDSKRDLALRRRLFRQYGYELVIIWGSEFRDKRHLLTERLVRAMWRCSLMRRVS